MEVTKYVITNNLSVLYNTREEAEAAFEAEVAKYRYGKDYVYCNEYREDEQFVQPLNSNGKPLCTIAKTNIIAIKEYK